MMQGFGVSPLQIRFRQSARHTSRLQAVRERRSTVERNAYEPSRVHGVGKRALVGVVHIQTVTRQSPESLRSFAHTAESTPPENPSTTLFIFRPSIHTISTEMSAGDTPEMRLACPKESQDGSF